MPRRGAPLIASFLLLVLALLPSTAARSQESQPPVFGAATQVVLLDLVARDSKGRPVSDLRADELQVFENGQRCEVQSFRVVRAAASVGRWAEGERRTIRVRRGSPRRTLPLRRTSRARPAAPTWLCCSSTGCWLTRRPYAREGGLSLLGKPFPPNTWFAVFKVHTRGTIVLQPFTADQREADRCRARRDDGRRREGGHRRSLAGRGRPAVAARRQPPAADPRTPPDAAPTRPCSTRSAPGCDRASATSPPACRPSTRCTDCRRSPAAWSRCAAARRSCTSPSTGSSPTRRRSPTTRW